MPETFFYKPQMESLNTWGHVVKIFE